MTSFDPRRLDARALARWTALLAKTPILDAPITASNGSIGLRMMLGVTLVWWAVTRNLVVVDVSLVVSPSAVVAITVALASTSALVVSACRALALRRAVARCAWRCSRSVHRFGYVESLPTRIVFVPGPEVELVDVHVGALSRTHGDSAIRLRLRCGTMARSFRLRGSELDVPVQELAALASPRGASESYRDEPPVLVPLEARIPHRSALRVAVPSVVAALVLGAILALTLVVPALALKRCAGNAYDPACASAVATALPWPWVTAELARYPARRQDMYEARVRSRFPSPFRAPLVALARSEKRLVVDVACYPDDLDTSVPVVTQQTRARRTPFVTLGSLQVIRYAWAQVGPDAESAPSHLVARCTFEHGEATTQHDGTGLLAMTVHVRWELVIDHETIFTDGWSFDTSIRWIGPSHAWASWTADPGAMVDDRIEATLRGRTAW